MKTLLYLLAVFVILLTCSRDWNNPFDTKADINPQVPNEGLVAYYPFNGNANDESGNGNNCTILGATLIQDRFRNSNSAFNFDGENDFLKAYASKLPQTERTLSIWFFTNSVNNRPGIIGYGGSGSYGTTWFMGLNVIGRQSFHMSSHSLINAIDYYYPEPPIGKWYNWIMTTDSTGTKIYVNGDLKQSNSTFVNNTYVNNRELGIGVITRWNGSAPYTDGNVGYFKGILDDIRIYNRALTQAEIQALYHEGGWTK